MENQTDKQLELFSKERGALAIKKLSSGSLFTRIRGHEKVMLVILCVITTGIISFSLGVERGKRLSMSSSNFQPILQPSGVTEDRVKENKTETEQVQQAIIKKEEPIKEAIPVKTQSFTIQLASYKTKTSAQKGAEILKKRGLSPVVLPKGNYIILCVGNFSTKETAKPLVTELQKQYKGCYIRRL